MRRGPNVENGCVFCKQSPETVSHIPKYRRWVRYMWLKIINSKDSDNSFNLEFFEQIKGNVLWTN